MKKSAFWFMLVGFVLLGNQVFSQFDGRCDPAYRGSVGPLPQCDSFTCPGLMCPDPIANVTYVAGCCHPEPNVWCDLFSSSFASQIQRDCECDPAPPLYPCFQLGPIKLLNYVSVTDCLPGVCP